MIQGYGTAPPRIGKQKGEGTTSRPRPIGLLQRGVTRKRKRKTRG